MPDPRLSALACWGHSSPPIRGSVILPRALVQLSRRPPTMPATHAESPTMLDRTLDAELKASVISEIPQIKLRASLAEFRIATGAF